MKLLRVVPLAIAFVLAGCNDDTSEQKEFIDQVKASTTPRVESIPELTKFEKMNIGGKVTAWNAIKHPLKVASTANGKIDKYLYPTS